MQESVDWLSDHSHKNNDTIKIIYLSFLYNHKLNFDMFPVENSRCFPGSFYDYKGNHRN